MLNLLAIFSSNLYSYSKFESYFRNIFYTDTSSFSSDGPIIIYENGKIISYSIVPNKEKFKTLKTEINKSDKLNCYIDETGQKFSFTLKDTIKIENDVYDLPEKMFIISDIEGNFKGFADILIAAKIIDNDFKWTFGNGHLVLNGDFFDRGINVTECLWLIYKLETEAENQGGKVHLILGNHELMNLNEKFRYVRNKYFENATALELDYKKWYALDTELGRWLRSKNAIEKIGNFLFLHGGISKDFPSDKYSISDINQNIRLCIDKNFKEGESSKDLFIGSQGPLWYRGLVDTLENQKDVDRTLNIFDADKMILGHTIVDDMRYLYNKKVITIDLEH